MTRKHALSEIENQIFEMLDHVVSMWNEQDLESYRIIFKREGRGWELYCPEFGDSWQTTDRSEMERHRWTTLWRGFSQAYWLGNLLFQMLPIRFQNSIINESLYLQDTASHWANRVIVVESNGKPMKPLRRESLLWNR